MFRRSFFAFCAASGPFRYVASDMDGTLLSPSHTLTDYAKETLRQLTVEKKAVFMFNTGRMHADVKIVNDNLQTYFKSKNDGKTPDVKMFMSTSNGAVVHDAMSGKVLLENVISPKIAYELYNDIIPFNETRINCNLNQNDIWYCRHNWEEVLEFHQESQLQFVVCPETAPLAETATPKTIKEGDFSRVVKVFFTCWDRPLLERLEAYLQDRYKDELFINISASYCIDIQAKGIHKGRAVQDIFRHLIKEEGEEEDTDDVEEEVEKRMKQTIAFGDDLNDVKMLTQVGKGFVMQNANPKLKELHSELEVIDSNANDGVAKKIREVFDIDD
ncbi:haloacid dehalogenase-like hydrolase, putative [Angomonas deanei]|uniref:Haloacid dehalogenase-like hydrolase, putative n=1 Tax=Angomonas deanei TaxID=59799 RepID=A0A7G2CIZ6_9TRYP|nr:haloacid dehalogenase-like hydrolase, putative [Angomonas deanei]